MPIDERPADEQKDAQEPEKLNDDELKTVVGGLASGASSLAAGDTGNCISQL